MPRWTTKSVVMNVGGLEDTFHHLTQKLSRAGMRRLMETDYTEYLQGAVVSGGDWSNDGSWAELQEQTVKRRQRAENIIPSFRGPSPINRRTDALFNYMQTATGSAFSTGGVTEFYWPDYPPTSPSGNKDSSGSIADKLYGAQLGEGTAPARPILDVDDFDVAALRDLTHWWIQSEAGRLN